MASCKATLAESTKAFARAHSPTEDSDRLASRNQVVKSTDVEEPAPLATAAAAAAGAGDVGCCRAGGDDGNILNVNYCDVCFANLTLLLLLQTGPPVGLWPLRAIAFCGSKPSCS